jgi:hypothetical protein
MRVCHGNLFEVFDEPGGHRECCSDIMAWCVGDSCGAAELGSRSYRNFVVV